MFSYEVEGHMQQFSSFEQIKKFGLKSHLVGNVGAPLIYFNPTSTQVTKPCTPRPLNGLVCCICCYTRVRSSVADFKVQNFKHLSSLQYFICHGSSLSKR